MTLLRYLFGCRHAWSWPRRNRKGSWKHYQVCLICGQEREYSGELAA